MKGASGAGAVAAVVGVAVLAMAGCRKEPVGPIHRTPGEIVVTTVSELDRALLTSIAGDTIEIRGEFASAIFEMQTGYTIPASRSPLRIVGIARSTFRPVLVFPSSVTPLTFIGNHGSSVEELDFEGGLDVFHLQDSDVTLSGLNVRNNARDGVLAEGNSDGTVEDNLFENPGRFGINAAAGADLTIRNNTIIHAADSGIRIDSNATITNNNIYGSVRNGIFCDAHATSPVISCNNAFQSGIGPNYACGDHAPATSNFELDPQFCIGEYTLRERSPLAPANSGSCGLIGRFGVGDCLP